jgi:hypothetical protein
MAQSDDIKKLISNHSRSLQKLKERQALEGLATPPHILIEIEDTEEKIKNLQKELNQIEPASPPKTPIITSDNSDGKLYVMNPLRELMEQIFMDEVELRQFCQDHFKHVSRRLRNTDGWDHIIGQIILYCETRGELDDLWSLLQLKNPRVYQQYEDYRYKR